MKRFSDQVDCLRWISRRRRFGITTLLLIVTSPPVWGDDGKNEAIAANVGHFPHACVAADHPLASEAGAEILRKGGNVVDAAVATAFALSVVRPESCGLGGGGFLVYWDASKGEAVAIDYRERAPGAADREMYLTPAGQPPQVRLSQTGGLAIATPGEVVGLCFTLQKYGTLDLPAVLAPAIRLAREGFLVDETFRLVQQEVLADFAKHPEYATRFQPLFELYLNKGRTFADNARFRSPLATVLERIAAEGATGFSDGPVAKAIVDEVRRQGGILTRDDLSSMQPVVREPVRGEFQGYDIIGMPPPSSGGIAIVEALNILSAYERQHPPQSLKELGHNSPSAVHLITEAMKHAFADRATFLGDADFVDVPVKHLLSRQHADHLADKINPDHTLPLDDYGRFAPVEDSGTSHFCVIDREGNAVACTGTINTLFGSYVVEPTFGIVLNNEMDDFAAVPGQPNAFGLIQSEANAVAPGKKPLSSMSPTILLKNGKATVAVGGSGGPRIISGTLQVLLNIVAFNLPVGEAVDSPRFHHQWLPDTLFLEPGLARTIKKPLQQRQHTITVREELGVVQTAVRSETGVTESGVATSGVTGACDPRKGGRPAGD